MSMPGMETNGRKQYGRLISDAIERVMIRPIPAMSNPPALLSGLRVSMYDSKSIGSWLRPINFDFSYEIKFCLIIGMPSGQLFRALSIISAC